MIEVSTEDAVADPEGIRWARRLGSVTILLGLTLSLVFATAGPGQGSPGDIVRASVSDDEKESVGDSFSMYGSLSVDGRYVAFVSPASDLVANDLNGQPDVFVRDLVSGETTLVSVASNADQGNGISGYQEGFLPRITPDGRYVTFASEASNLVSDDTNGEVDIFVHDRQTGTTTRVSVAGNGAEGDGRSFLPSISADGRFVAFTSHASNLVPGDTNQAEDSFVHDRQTGATRRVSVTSAGAEANNNSSAPVISANGRYVVFDSEASNLVPDDTNATLDIFVHDLQTGQTSRLSVDGAGAESNGTSRAPSISASGRFVSFVSVGSNLVPSDTNAEADVFVRDRQAGQTSRVSVSTDGGQSDGTRFDMTDISGNGRYVVFDTDATNLVAGDTNAVQDVFLHDRQTGETERVSLAEDGSQGDDGSYWAAVSPDGGSVAFSSDASNLVVADTNNTTDVFVVTYLSSPPDSTTSTTSSTTTTTTTSTVPPTGGDHFLDDDGHIFEDDIDWLFEEGITKGCNPPVNDRFCPDDSVTRGQMAAFLVRALGYVDDGGGDLFTDDDGSVFEGDIDRLGTAGVTRGCNPPANDQFCPDDLVTRGQMAAFLRRAAALR